MDLNQRKLIKAEWNSIEVPVSESELQILNLLKEGFNNINIKKNYTLSIINYLKLDSTIKIHDFIFIKYLKDRCDKLQKEIKKLKPDYNIIKLNITTKLNSADKIRIEKNDTQNIIDKSDLYENVLLYHLNKFIKYFKKEKKSSFTFHYYTIYKLIDNTVTDINNHIISLIRDIIRLFATDISFKTIIQNADQIIEKNKNLLKYNDISLYDHQKHIFSQIRQPGSKLILYMAPTGTGKTLTPLALSEEYKVIFVCAARHVGLALAKSAISINKKVAFAFGCESADDIRLHYFSAKEYVKNKKSGGIGKVDNSVGDNVEIMICDIKSYLYAMFYMRSFNMDENNNYMDDKIITYWDEPTITLDYENHEFHEIIKKNWTENLIPNIVLSSATLPKPDEITETISDFRNKFPDAQIIGINSYDCKKSIPIVNEQGYIEVPHYMNEDYDIITEIANFCSKNLTLLRYFDLKETCDFIIFMNENNYMSNRYLISNQFETLDDLNMQNIKKYYLDVLRNVYRGTWGAVYTHFKINRKPRLKLNDKIDSNGNKIFKSNSIGPGSNDKSSSVSQSLEGKEILRIQSENIISQNIQQKNVGVYVATKDAYSLTDGPTIFISNDVEKIGKFCIQQANIPSVVMDDLMDRIKFNNKLNSEINTKEEKIDYLKEESEKIIKNTVDTKHNSHKIQGRNKSTKDIRMNNRNDDVNESASELTQLTTEINNLRLLIKTVSLNDVFIPNKTNHINKWAPDFYENSAFTSNIDETLVNEIMLLHGVNDSWKVLLMMGIGVFMIHSNQKYTEIMKTLADQQKLYMIIASSDYIYGTNYQFCHGYLSKDLDLSQEKIIQALGRIGRNNIQQEYSVRFRDNKHIYKLFMNCDNLKPEVKNMNLLFNSNNISWNGERYIECE